MILIALAILAAAGLLVYARVGTQASTSTSSSDEVSKLALGTLDLEDTDQAVDAAQARSLLPLWQLLEELQTNPATAPAETKAVIEAINSAMTASQLQAIEAANYGSATKTASASKTGSASATSTSGSAASDPMLLGGGNGMPMDGGGPMGAPGAQGTSSSSGATTVSEPSLISQVVELLQKKIQN